jgi:hypothetical protein
MESPKGLIDIRGHLAPLSWMISSRSLIVGVICSKCVIPSCAHLSWHGKAYFNIWKDCLWMIIMSSMCPCDSNQKMVVVLVSQVSIGRGIMAPRVQRQH